LSCMRCGMRCGLLQELARLVKSAPAITVHCSFAARPSPPSDCTVQEHLAVVMVAVVLIMVVVAAPRSARVGEPALVSITCATREHFNYREH